MSHGFASPGPYAPPPPPPPRAPDSGEVVGRRIGAALLDLVPLIVLFVVLGLLLGDNSTEDDNLSINLNGWPAVLFFALVLAYYGVCEALWAQTLGKRLLGIKVADAAGGRPTAGRIAIRTVLRIIDGLPFLYLLGLILVLVTPGRQRLGDLAARTVVTRA